MPATYNPKTGKVGFTISQYEADHERAHARQQSEGGWLFRLWNATHHVPFLGRTLAFFVEFDAAAQAIADAPEPRKSRHEAAFGVLSYAFALTFIPDITGWVLFLASKFKRKAK